MNNTYKNPTWWSKDEDSAWERTKAALQRDWDQTKHDFGGKEPNTDQDVDDTLKQAAGKEPIPPRGQPTYEDVEPAYRFGYGARLHYGKRYREWDNKLEEELRRDWNETYPERSKDWETDEEYIRSGWNHRA